MYLNIGQGNALGIGNIGGLSNDFYWSSTENDSGTACFQDFTTGQKFCNNFKGSTDYVRAIRAF